MGEDAIGLGVALIVPDKKIGGLLLHIQASIMRRKACDALCISHVYQYSGKVSKIIQNSVKFSTNFFTFIPLLAVMMRQGYFFQFVVKRFIAVVAWHRFPPR